MKRNKKQLMKVEGKHITIRKLKLSDANDIYKNVNHKDIVRWTKSIPYPYLKDGAGKFIRQTYSEMRTKKSFIFGITLPDTDKVIGIVSLIRINWENKDAELGYWIGKRYWNKGYTTEAAKLIIGYGFRNLKLHRIHAVYIAPNKASGKVMEKAGLRKEGISREAYYKNSWHDLVSYAILAKEYKK